MDWSSAPDAAKALGVSARRIRQLCAKGRVPDAVRIAGVWLIPWRDGRPCVVLQAPGRPRKTQV